MALNPIAGTEFLVNEAALDDQGRSRTIQLADGSFLVVWETSDSNQDGASSAIKARIVSSDGAEVLSEFRVNDSGAGTQQLPEVALLPTGNVAFVYQSGGDPGLDGHDVLIRVFDPSGNEIIPEFAVNTATTGDQTDPHIAVLANGDLVVTWSTDDATQDADGGAVKARILSVDGLNISEVTAEFLVNSESDDDQLNPFSLALAGGNFVTFWETTDATQDGWNVGLKARIFDPVGGQVVGEFLVNDLFRGDQDSVVAAALPDGGFVAAWRTSHNELDEFNSDVRARIFNADGSVRVAEFRVNDFAGHTETAPSIFVMPDGRIVIAWETLGAGHDEAPAAIKARIFNPDGTESVGEFLVNELGTGSQTEVSIAGDGRGQVVFSWTTSETQIASGGDGSQDALKARSFDIGSIWQGTGGNDDLQGNHGRDEFFGRSGNDILEGLGDEDRLFGHGGSDTLKGGGKQDLLRGGAGGDRLFGGSGGDDMGGGRGNDTLIGEKGNDELFGQGGRDTLKGGSGDDRIIGGKGNDKIHGQGGADVLVFGKRNGDDTIVGFKNGTDRLDLTAFNFAGKGQAKSKFYEIGGRHNDVFGFKHKGTEIEIRGMDLKNLNNQDLIV